MSYNNFDYMDGHEFEYFCADILRRTGFQNVQVTQSSGDQGVDIIAFKDGDKYAIQCKNYASKLGNTPIQEVFAGKMFYKCDVAAVMTNQTFTPGAIELAQATGVLLWDRYTLIKLLNQARQNVSASTTPIQEPTDDDYYTVQDLQVKYGISKDAVLAKLFSLPEFPYEKRHGQYCVHKDDLLMYEHHYEIVIEKHPSGRLNYIDVIDLDAKRQLEEEQQRMYDALFSAPKNKSTLMLIGCCLVFFGLLLLFMGYVILPNPEPYLSQTMHVGYVHLGYLHAALGILFFIAAFTNRFLATIIIIIGIIGYLFIGMPFAAKDIAKEKSVSNDYAYTQTLINQNEYDLPPI